MVTDAFNLTWNYHLSYLFPPFSLIPLCLKKIERDQAECILIAQAWKSRLWYPILLSMLSHWSAFTVTSVPISSSTPRNEQDSHLYPKVFQTSCMESFRQRLQGQVFPQEVSEVLLSSWRKSTARQYKSAWRSWSGWCDSWQINCFSTSVKNILTYLAHLFHEKSLQYCTINVYRSAICAFYISIDGMVIGKHPLVSKFMKEVFCLRPLNRNIL